MKPLPLKSLLSLLSLCVLSLPCEAQNWNTIKADASLLTGEGYGTTVAEADKNALADLGFRLAL